MDCRTYQELVAAHVDGALEPHEKADADAHVNTCSACAQLRGSNERVRAVLREHAPKHTLPAEHRSQILNAIETAQPDPVGARAALASSRWRMRLVVVGAVAAALLLVVGNPFRSSQSDLLSALVQDVRSADAGALSVELQADSVERLRAYYRNTGKFTFDQTVEDFGGFGLRPVGATVGDIAGVPTTLTVYQSPTGKVICRRFLSGTVRLPPGGERIGDATVFTVGEVTVRVQRMGNVVCVLASAMPRNEFVRMLLQPMNNG